jgi:ribosomal protein S12 methylthiotransferase accessory factor
MHRPAGNSLNATLGTLPDLLDPETGIITGINFYKVRADDPQFEHCHATITDTGRLTGGLTIPGTGGTALTREVALAKAIGESVERYCGEFCHPDSITVSPFRDIRACAIDAARFALFHPTQYGPRFPFQAASQDAATSWTPARSLTDGRDVLVPAAMVHVSASGGDGEPLTDVTPVSGYACGNSYEEAVLSGICEVVERDAFMIFWYNRLALPGFDLRAAGSPVLRSIVQRYQPVPAQIFCADMTTECGIPAAIALMVAQSPRWPAAVVATAAHPDPEQAIGKALLELAANQLYVRSLYEQPAYRKLPASPAEVIQPEDHGLFYCSPERLPYLDALIRPRTVVRPTCRRSLATGSAGQDVEICVRRLAAAGLEVLVADLTTADIADLGFKVVKVLIPGMHPIDFGYWRHLGGRRLYETPARLGYPGARGPDDLNLFPHPFP